MNRREFIGSTIALAAGATLVKAMPLEKPWHQIPEDHVWHCSQSSLIYSGIHGFHFKLPHQNVVDLHCSLYYHNELIKILSDRDWIINGKKYKNEMRIVNVTNGELSELQKYLSFITNKEAGLVTVEYLAGSCPDPDFSISISDLILVCNYRIKNG